MPHLHCLNNNITLYKLNIPKRIGESQDLFIMMLILKQDILLLSFIWIRMILIFFWDYTSFFHLTAEMEIIYFLQMIILPVMP